MRRFFIFFPLLLLLAALVLRKFNADRVLEKSRQKMLTITALDLVRGMIDSLGYDDVKLEVTTRATRSWAGTDVIGKNWIRLPKETAESRSAYAHGQATLRFGLYLLARRDAKAVDRRRWALRFGHVFPIFTCIVAIFAVLVAKIPLGWILAIILSSLALASCAQIFSVKAERQAAELACLVLEKKRVLPRLSEEEDVIAATRAWSWWRVLPGILARLA